MGPSLACREGAEMSWAEDMVAIVWKALSLETWSWRKRWRFHVNRELQVTQVGWDDDEAGQAWGDAELGSQSKGLRGIQIPLPTAPCPLGLLRNIWGKGST